MKGGFRRSWEDLVIWCKKYLLCGCRFDMITFTKINLRHELKHLMMSRSWNEFCLLINCGNIPNVSVAACAVITSPGRTGPGRHTRSSCVCTYALVYWGCMKNLTSAQGKLWTEGNGGLPGLLAGVMDKSKARLNCHSVLILRLHGCWLEWLSPNYAVIILLHCNWLGRYANTCHLGW